MLIMNIRFEYLYRDAGNFKNWGSVVLSNPQDISLEAINKLWPYFMTDPIYFVAEEISIPDLHFKDCNLDLDHKWHEVHCFKETRDEPNDPKGRTIIDFISDLARSLSGLRISEGEVNL